jgi:RNA polymerase sigma-54 factor
MALSASLQLRQSQSLVMTPQLMQSIRLLQFSHVELTRFIEQEAERNPLLELVTPESQPIVSAERCNDTSHAKPHRQSEGRSGAAMPDWVWAADSETSSGTPE